MGKAVTYNDLLNCERRNVAATEALAEIELKIGEIRGMFALDPTPDSEVVIRKLQNASAIARRVIEANDSPDPDLSVLPKEGAGE